MGKDFLGIFFLIYAKNPFYFESDPEPGSPLEKWIWIHVVSLRSTEFFNKAEFSNLLSYFHPKLIQLFRNQQIFIIPLFSIVQY